MPPPPRAVGGWVPLPPPAGEATAARAVASGDDMASLMLLPAGAAIVPRSRFARKLKPKKENKKFRFCCCSHSLFVVLFLLCAIRELRKKEKREARLSLSLSRPPFRLLLFSPSLGHAATWNQSPTRPLTLGRRGKIKNANKTSLEF